MAHQDQPDADGDYWDRKEPVRTRGRPAARTDEAPGEARPPLSRATLLLTAMIVLLLLVAAAVGWFILSRMGASPLAGSAGSGGQVMFVGGAGDLRATPGNAVGPGNAVDGKPTALLASRQVSPKATGTTDGVFLPLTPELAQSLAGKAVRVTVMARAPTVNPTAKFALAYSGAEANTGWLVFTPDATFRAYNLTFRAPKAQKAGPAHVGIWSDISGQGRVLEIRDITVELAP
jgi:hypothetical protein